MEHTITVILPYDTKEIRYMPSKNLSLKDLFACNDIFLKSDCGGNGKCQKCNVTVYNPDGSIINTPSCKIFPDSDLTVSIPLKNISENVETIAAVAQSETVAVPKKNYSKVYVAADLGSTTITIALIDAHSSASSSIIDTLTFNNPTLIYGADIISRQQAQMNGKHVIFSNLIKKSIIDAVKKITLKNSITPDCVKCLFIAGNTTMQHFMFGFDVKSLASYPFIADKLSYDTFYLDGIKTITLPSFSTFIGADIISGLYYINNHENISGAFLFLDLGTNAEIVLYSNNVYICTSAAAGPAFEGTNISCGCAAIPGAIKNITIKKYGISHETIGNKLPVGICGSGIMSLYSQLIKNNIINDSKTFTDKYIDTGFPIAKSVKGDLIISQNDIRELQLAIAAIRTGIEILLKHSELTIKDLSHIFISGSFGKALDIETILTTGLFPDVTDCLRDIIVLSGNTSLKGAIYALSDSDYEQKINRIISSCHEIHLANHPSFNRLFLSNI